MEDINHKELYIVRLNLYQVSKIGKVIETKSKLVLGGKRVGDRECLLMDTGLLCRGKNVKK